MAQKPEPGIYPQEIIFKAIFRTESSARDGIAICLSEKEIFHSISERTSEKGNFISYTITASFESEHILHQVCSEIKSISGYMTMM